MLFIPEIRDHFWIFFIVQYCKTADWTILLILIIDQYDIIAFKKGKPLVVTKIANPAVFGFGYVCKMIEIKSLVLHYIMWSVSFTSFIQFLKNGMVMFQNSVNFSYIIAWIPQFFVIKSIPASIAAKFLVGSSPQRLAAFQTFPFFHFNEFVGWKIANIKILSVFNRLQTIIIVYKCLYTGYF